MWNSPFFRDIYLYEKTIKKSQETPNSKKGLALGERDIKLVKIGIQFCHTGCGAPGCQFYCCFLYLAHR